MSDLLARHSAVFSEDHVATVESGWFLQGETASGLQLSTQENRFTTAMKIGELAAYMVDQADWNRPSLGVISSIHRQDSGSVTIGLDKFSDYGEAVWLNKYIPGDDYVFIEKDAFPGVIGRDTAQAYTLFVPSQHRLPEGDVVALQSSRGIEFTRIGKLIGASKGFTLTKIEITTRTLKKEDELVAAI